LPTKFDWNFIKILDRTVTSVKACILCEFKAQSSPSMDYFN